MVRVIVDFVMIEPVRFAPVRLAPVRIAPVKFAARRFLPARFLFVKLQCERSVPGPGTHFVAARVGETTPAIDATPNSAAVATTTDRLPMAEP